MWVGTQHTIYLNFNLIKILLLLMLIKKKKTIYSRGVEIKGLFTLMMYL